ncbi:SLC13 family permease [Tunicatimonas pelagia]|uniref:SLC13 family permease n=1 Tax=Tunicatimonas pelagia TaxID=931531 RepID=UPI002665AA52|nr:DASS family sodium-coupled anion symporter [Tunicatimonas pelagia]WKN42528.1 DASS family sodium-coupled anion symporter [Tunicatimonas pelagia]
MADSRFAALRFLQKKWPLIQKVSFFLAVTLLALFLTQLLRSEAMSTSAVNALFLLLFAAGLWISEAIPPFAVSILVIGYSMYFLDSIDLTVVSEDWERYVSTWSSPIIWILIGGFFLAMGAQVTAFDRKFSSFVLRYFGNKPYNILLGCMLVTAVLSMFMSNTATTAMMVAILTPIIQQVDRKDPLVKAVFLGVAAAATVGGMGTVIGSPPNAIALGIIQSQGLSFGFSQWMLVGVPVAFISVLAIWLVLKNHYKTQYDHLELQVSAATPGISQRTQNRYRIIVVATFTLTVGLWLTSTLHSIPVAVVSFLPIVSFTVTGVVRAEDLRLLPWDTLILVAGGLTLGMAISDTGLATHIVSGIPIFNNLVVMLLIMGWLTTFLSNIMSNTAAASILIPVGSSFLPDHTLLVSVVIGLSASTALFLPISTPPNAIAFSTGYLKQSDFRLLGILVGLGGPLLVALVVLLLY